jgi:RNA polymerase sigma factor (sigma-70 family)
VVTAAEIKDATSVSTALQVDDRAFDSLYRVHRPQVYSYALATLRNTHDAEDATQTTFLKALYALDRGMDPRETGSWLIGITKNVCRDRFRDAKRQPIGEPIGEWVKAQEPQDPRFAFEDLCREILALSPRQRRILVMREFEGRTFEEISQELGITAAAAQALLVRARRELRAELELPMTCEQARRATVRNLNDVATLEERQALQRHMRRCAACAKFVGQRQRGLVRNALFLPFFPFRRLGFLAGTSSGPASSTVGGVAGMTVKLVAITAVGTLAVGETAIKLGVATPAAPVRTVPAAHHAPAATHHAFRPAFVPYAPAQAAKRTVPVLKHPRPTASGSTLATSTSVPTNAFSVTTPATATPDTGSPSTEPDPDTTASDPGDPVDSGQGGAAPDTSDAPSFPSASVSPEQTAAPTTGAEQSSVSSSSSDASSSTIMPTPADTTGSDSQGSPSLTGNGNGSNSGKGQAHAVGQGGTPPGLANKPANPPGQPNPPGQQKP